MIKPSKATDLTLRRLLAMNLAVGCAVTLVVWSFRPGMSASSLLAAFAFYFVFASAVGIPFAPLVRRLGWRLESLRYPYNWLAVTAEILAFTAAGTLLGVVLLRAIGVGTGGSLWTVFWGALRFAVVVALTVGLGVSALDSKRQELEAARREIEVRELAEANATKLLAEARLASLQSRIHPHFLFNTLNSIAALIPEDPKRAEDTVQRLAALLRFSLDAGDARLVTLALECKIVGDYLEIEKARFGSRLRYAIDLPPGVTGLLVPPLAVQTLVENSVKHAVAVRRDGAAIDVSARVEGDELVVAIRDDGPGFELANVAAGHGLDNLQQRLEGLFGEKASLEVAPPAAGGAALQLRLPVTRQASERS